MKKLKIVFYCNSIINNINFNQLIKAFETLSQEVLISNRYFKNLIFLM